MTRVLLVVQVASFWALGAAFLATGNYKLGFAQILFGAGTVAIYA